MSYLTAKCADDARAYSVFVNSFLRECIHGGEDANATDVDPLPADPPFRNISVLVNAGVEARLDDDSRTGTRKTGKGRDSDSLKYLRVKTCPKSLQCSYVIHKRNFTKSVLDPCKTLPGYAEICMRTCDLCTPSKVMPLVVLSSFTIVVLGALLLCICCARRLLRMRNTPHIEFYDEFGIGDQEDASIALVSRVEDADDVEVANQPTAQLCPLEIDARSQDGASALVERRAQMNELSARDTFSSASVVETFSMLTEDIFNRTKLFGIVKLGVYEHWIIKPEDVRLDRVDSLPVDRGTFGEVRRAWLYGGTDVAIKEAVCVNREQGLYTLANEMRLLRRIRHPNIVLFHGALVDRDRLSLSLVLEWVDGMNLERYVRESRDVGSPDVNGKVTLSLSHRELKLLIDVARGMQYLHAQVPVILHRDLKPANVLIETAIEPPQAKIADFGLSAVERTGGHNQRVGTPAYMAPEVQRSERYSTSADVYSFGCVLLFSLTSKHPRASLLPAVCAWAEGDDCSKDLVDAVIIAGDCLQASPPSRPPFSRLLHRLSDLAAAENKRESISARIGQGASSSNRQYNPPRVEATTEVQENP